MYFISEFIIYVFVIILNIGVIPYKKSHISIEGWIGFTVHYFSISLSIIKKHYIANKGGGDKMNIFGTPAYLGLD